MPNSPREFTIILSSIVAPLVVAQWAQANLALRAPGVCAAQKGTGPMLSAMVQTLVTVFEAHRHSACLKTLATAVEFFGEEANAAALLEYALTSSCHAAAPVYKASSPPTQALVAAKWDVYRSLRIGYTLYGYIGYRGLQGTDGPELLPRCVLFWGASRFRARWHGHGY